MNEQSNRNQQPQTKGLIKFLLESRANWLLIFVLISSGVYAAGLPKAWLFAASAVAIIPLAGLIGNATEELAAHTGPGIGGLLNATFGNATELIISLFALNAGLFEVVKASISGSIIANILLVLGTSMLFGGWRRQKQTFSRVHAGASSSMLFLAVVALIMPAVFDIAIFGKLKLRLSTPEINLISLWVCGVLILTYVASLVFSLKTHSTTATGGGLGIEAELSVTNAIILLAIATVLVAMESEFLVSAIDAATAFTADVK